MKKSMGTFSLWCDFCERGFLENRFENYINNGVSGATSNPAIFSQALKSPNYTQEIQKLKAQGLKAKEIYENLACEDIKRAAKLLDKTYRQGNGNGYISLEIDPFLAENTEESIKEGKRLYQKIQMPNVMIKVPATHSGYEIMEALSREDIPVNATLIFSPNQAKECAQALARGRKNRSSSWQGVVSVFVSRLDRAVDSLLSDEWSGLRAKLGNANAISCYEVIENLGYDFIRTLFASSGVKDGSFDGSGNALAKDYYVRSLKLPHSVNTAPLDTMDAHLGSLSGADVNEGIKTPEGALFQEARSVLESILHAGIDLESLQAQLMQEGMKAFYESFEEMLRML